MSMAPKEITILTPLRGIAAVGVALYHCLLRLPAIREPISANTAFFDRGPLWVDFFFLLSGFVMMHVYGHWFEERSKTKSAARFFSARFARVYPLHLFTLLLFVLVVVVADEYSFGDSGFSLCSLATNILLLHSMGLHDDLTWNWPSWSISVEWWAYFVFPLIPLWLRTPRAKLGLLLVSLLVLYALYSRFGHLNITVDYGFIRCISEFCIGLSLYVLVYTDDRFHAIERTTIFLLALLTVVAAMSCSETALGDYWVVMSFAFLLVVAARYEGRWSVLFENKALVTLGNISYSIYMLHVLILFLLETAVLFFFDYEIFGGHVGVGASTAVVAGFLFVLILLSWCSYRWVELPARRWIKKKVS